MRSVIFAVIVLLGLSGALVGAQKLRVQNDRVADAFDIGFLAMAPKIMCAETIETVFITLTNFTRPIEVMVVILDGADPEDVVVRTPVRLVGTPCACMEVKIPPIKGGRRVVTLQLLARRTDLQCDDFEVQVSKKIYIDACAAETFIETDQPVYIAGQTVKFRVLTLKTDLRPDTSPVSKITAEDPNAITMVEWKDVQGELGLIEQEFPLSKEPPLGQWTIRVMHHGRPYKLTFQVEKHERPRYEITIEKPPYLTVDTKIMNLEICARYPLGQAVRGSIVVKIGVTGLKVASGDKPPILKFKEEDTGLDGCYEANVDLDRLKLCSDEYTFDNARLRMTVIYTDATTGLTIKEIDTETIIAKAPYKISFDVPPVYKPGLPYHGRIVIRKPDDTPGEKIPITLTALGDEHGLYEETLYPNEDGIIYFKLPEIVIECNCKLLTLKAQSFYKPTGSCLHEDSINVIAPEASVKLHPQFSPTGSFIQIQPITKRVKINSLQTITIYVVSQKPEYQGVNLHLMFMSRGKILKSTEVFIFPEDYDGFRHPGTFLPIPVAEHEPHTEKELAEPHIGPIDTPVSLVKPGTPKVTHRKFKITAAMSPVTSVIVYYVRKDNEVVSEMIDFNVEEVFENEVRMKFAKPEEMPLSLTKLRIRAAPGSLCAYGVVDKTIHLMGEQNRITKKRVFNALAKLQLSAEGGYIERSHKCGDIFQFPIFGKQVGMDQSGTLPDGMMQLPGFEPELLDGSISFMNMGIVYLTNLAVETSPCPKFKPGNDLKKKAVGGPQDTISAADTLIDVPGKTLKIRSFFPDTWLWEIKRTSGRGEADINVLVPDRITTWIGRGFCTNPKHGAGVSDLFPLRVFQPFFLELQLPPSVIRGERVPVTVVVYDYLEDCMVIKLSLKKSDDYTPSQSNPEKTVCVCNGKPATAVFYIVPHVIGQIPVEVYGISMEDNIENSICGDDLVDMVQFGHTDSVKKPLRVEVRGMYVEDVFSSYFCPSDYSDGVYEERILLRELPANVVPGSVSAVVTITGDMIAPSLTNLKRLLRLPLESGEQNLLDFAPNVFILRYLKSTDQLTPELRAQAVANMIVGYERQETFHRKDGSYNVFRDDLEGSSWLTAYVVRVFAFASQFMPVDIGNLQDSVDWLKSLQDVNTGCFRPTGRIIHRALKGSVRDEVALTAYVMSAMLEAGISRRDPAIKKGMECLDLALNGMGDGYTAALMAYTFALADQPCLTKAINILNQLAVEEHGTIHWGTGREDVPYAEPYLHRKAPAQDIEMTSYVLLSYSIYREDSYVILSGAKIARWIINQLNSIGGFASTQDTMIALQALSEYARVSRIVRGHTKINVNVKFGCEKEPRNLDVTEDNRFTLQQLDVPLIPEQIIVDATGDACAMSQVTVKYNIIPEEPRNPKFILTYESQQIGDDCGTQRMKICATYAGEDGVSNLAVISIKLISGYSPEEASVNDLRKRGLKNGLKGVEVDGKNVDIFVDKFTLKQRCFSLQVRKEFDVRDTKKGVITLYDYYEPSRTVSTFFKFGCEHEAEKDEKDPRPGHCPNVNIDEAGSIGTCPSMCQDDDSCEGTVMKCCSNGCGRMCMLPTGLEKSASAKKFGSCPMVEPSTKRHVCDDQCDSDDDCDGVKKCCRGPKGCNSCVLPSELNPCPSCLSKLPAAALVQALCKYDFVVSAKLLKNDEIQIKRDLKANKSIKLPIVRRNIKSTCKCPVLGTQSLVLLMFNNQDLDLAAKTLTFHGNSYILKLTKPVKDELEDLNIKCGAKTP